MAKLNYSKPLFDIRPIPLTEGGVGGGCAINPTSGENICPVMSPLGDMIFTDEMDACDTVPQSGDLTICYTVYDSDYTVYNS